jgi:hypothetical protein
VVRGGYWKMTRRWSASMLTNRNRKDRLINMKEEVVLTTSISAGLAKAGGSSSISIFFFRNNLPEVNITPSEAQERL